MKLLQNNHTVQPVKLNLQAGASPTKANISKEGDHRHRMTEKEEDEELLQQTARTADNLFIFEKTPPYIKNGEMRDYQIRGLNW